MPEVDKEFEGEVGLIKSDETMRMDAVKAAVGNKTTREEMMAKLSVDVLKHLSNKHTAETGRQQPTKGE